MSGRIDIQLALKVAAMESEMNALHPDLRTSSAEINASLESLRFAMAERDTRYEKELRSRDWWLYGLLISLLHASVSVAHPSTTALETK